MSHRDRVHLHFQMLEIQGDIVSFEPLAASRLEVTW